MWYCYNFFVHLQPNKLLTKNLNYEDEAINC